MPRGRSIAGVVNRQGSGRDHAKVARNLEICRLRSIGHQLHDIAAQFGITLQRVQQIVAVGGIVPRPYTPRADPGLPVDEQALALAQQMLAEDVAAGRAEIAAGLAARRARNVAS